MWSSAAEGYGVEQQRQRRRLLQNSPPAAQSTLQAANAASSGTLAVLDPLPSTQVFAPACPRTVACDTSKVCARPVTRAARASLTCSQHCSKSVAGAVFSTLAPRPNLPWRATHARTYPCTPSQIDAAYLRSGYELLAAPTRCLVLPNVRDGPTSQLLAGLANDTTYTLRIITEDTNRWGLREAAGCCERKGGEGCGCG